MKKIFLMICLIPFLAGCAKLAHLEQLLTLKGYSDNKDLQAQHVKEQNENFERLITVVESNSIRDYPDQQSFTNAFGEPVFSRSAKKDGKVYTQWLYRYATKYFGSQKIYLYFDKEGQLNDWENYIPEK